jgi:heavy metal sensor kinase
MKGLSTLRVRFAVWVGALLLGALAAFGAYVYFNMARSLAAAVDDSLRLSATQALATLNVENGQINFSDSIPEGTAPADLVERGLTIRILSSSGKGLQAFGPYGSAPVEAGSLSAAAAGRPTFWTYMDSGEGDRVRMYTVPILEDSRLVGVLQVAQSLGNVQDTLDRLLTTLLLMIPLVVGLAGWGGYFLAARALAPIDTITRTARRISAEDLSERIQLPATNDEVGRLAATFDAMLARLDESFRRERQFTADASHELRTPLAAMQTILSVIRQERRTPEDYEQALDDLAGEADRLRALTENLLSLARSDVAPATPRGQVDLSALLQDVSDSLRPLAEAKGLTLECTVADGLRMTGDSDGLIRLFVNLLDNAIQFTEHGRVTVSARPHENDTLDVSIADTGCGIAPEHLAHVFDRFFRVDRSRASRGAGLGLAIAMGIARAHGGTIRVSSEVGVGSTFAVLLNGPRVIQQPIASVLSKRTQRRIRPPTRTDGP